MAPQQYVQVTLVDDGLSVRVYRDGVKLLDLVDTLDVGPIGTNGLLHFFRESNGNYAPGGRVARIRVFNGAMNDAEVAALAPLAPPAAPASSGAAVVADY